MIVRDTAQDLLNYAELPGWSARQRHAMRRLSIALQRGEIGRDEVMPRLEKEVRLSAARHFPRYQRLVACQTPEEWEAATGRLNQDAEY